MVLHPIARCVAIGCVAIVTVEFVGTALRRIVCRALRPPQVNKILAFNDSCYRCNGEKDCTDRHCSEHNLQSIIEVLDAARVSMDLCLYMLSCSELADAIKRAHDRGVEVRIVTDFDMAYNQGSKIFHLGQFGIIVKCKSSTKLMHHKFCIIDSPSRVKMLDKSNTRTSLYQRIVLRLIGNTHRGFLVTGSMNWTQQATSGNWDHMLVTSHLPLLKEFQEEFNILWSTLPTYDPLELFAQKNRKY